MLTHHSILQLMIKRCIQWLQRSIPMKWFNFFNTRECSIDNVICDSIDPMQCPFVMPSRRERTFHFRIRSYYTSHRGSLFEHRWDHRRVMVLHPPNTDPISHDHTTNLPISLHLLKCNHHLFSGFYTFHRGMSFAQRWDQMEYSCGSWTSPHFEYNRWSH